MSKVCPVASCPTDGKLYPASCARPMKNARFFVFHTTFSLQVRFFEKVKGDLGSVFNDDFVGLISQN